MSGSPEQEAKTNYSLSNDKFDDDQLTQSTNIDTSKLPDTNGIVTDAYSSHLFDLSNSINQTLNDILTLLPEVYKKKAILEIYAKDLANGSTDESLKAYFEKNKSISFPELTDVISTFRFLNARNEILSNFDSSENGSSSILEKHNDQTFKYKQGNDKHSISSNNVTNGSIHNGFDGSNIKMEMKTEELSRQKQLRANLAYRDQYILSFIPGTDIPDIDLNNQAKTVRDIWSEWNYGHKGKPALKDIERQHGTKWRRGRIAKSAQRRKKVIEFIESEFKKNQGTIDTVEQVVDELEKYRLTRGKGIFWLYGNIPDRLYDDKGTPLEDNDGQRLARHEFHQSQSSNDSGSDVNDVEMQFDDVLSDRGGVQGSQVDLKKDKEREENGVDEIDRAAREALVNSATAAVLAQQHESTQSTEGDLRRLENIQRLIDQHGGVGMSEIGDNTDPALAKL